MLFTISVSVRKIYAVSYFRLNMKQSMLSPISISTRKIYTISYFRFNMKQYILSPISISTRKNLRYLLFPFQHETVYAVTYLHFNLKNLCYLLIPFQHEKSMLSPISVGKWMFWTYPEQGQWLCTTPIAEFTIMLTWSRCLLYSLDALDCMSIRLLATVSSAPCRLLIWGHNQAYASRQLKKIHINCTLQVSAGRIKWKQ